MSGKCVEWLNGVSVVGRGEVGKTRWYSELLISQILRLCRYAIGEAPTAFSRNSFKERLSDDFPRVLALASVPNQERGGLMVRMPQAGVHSLLSGPSSLSTTDGPNSPLRSISPVRQNVSRL